MQKKLMTRAEFGKAHGVSRQMVDRWVRAGLPVGQDGRIDRAQGQAWLAANTSRGRSSGSGETFANARARKESSLADLRELELKEKRGELVSKKDAQLAFAALVTATKNHLLVLPDEIAPKVAALTDVREIRHLIDVEIRAALTELSRSPFPAEQGGNS
jgi:phage terminase Nu1 subunit (DNA packaging protein)